MDGSRVKGVAYVSARPPRKDPPMGGVVDVSPYDKMGGCGGLRRCTVHRVHCGFLFRPMCAYACAPAHARLTL